MCKLSIWCNPDYAPELFRYCGCVLEVPFTCYSGKYVPDSNVDQAYVKVTEEVSKQLLNRIAKTLDGVASGYIGAQFHVAVESDGKVHELEIDGKHDLPNIEELIGVT